MEKTSRPRAAAAAHGVLKSLLESPMQAFSQEQEKEKRLEEERGAPQSAFLGPTLWDKTLEYLDLEEFLSDNGLSSGLAPPLQHHHQQEAPAPLPSAAPPTPSVVDLSNHDATSARPNVASPNCPPPTGLPGCRNSPSPVDPDQVRVPVGYEPDPADLVLSSVPGQELFDPRRRTFSAEELKPQPMMKKARKVLVPEDLKDDRYWARRRKNNVAAKRSRDARRLKENQVAVRAGFLEQENRALRQEAADLRRQLGRSDKLLAKYEALHGPL